MPQHRINRHGPLRLKVLGQLLQVRRAGDHAPPHLGPGRLAGRVQRHEPVLLHLDEAQEGNVPAAVALRVGAHAGVGIIHESAAERVVGRQAAQLGEELVAGDVVHPRGRHGLLEGARVDLVAAGGGDALDAAELREGVDAVRREGVDELLDRGLED